MYFPEAIRQYRGQPLTRQLLLDLLKDYRRPYDKISELIAQKFLTPVKRGVFVPGPAASVPGPDSFLLANHLWGPSYVTADTALSFWGMIPERVFEISSATTNARKLYATAVGRFSYLHLNLPYYSYGIQRVEIAPKQAVLMAGREKALCDKIVGTPQLKLRSVRQARAYLVEDLRISESALADLNPLLIELYLEGAPKQESLSTLAKTLTEI